VSQGRSVVQGVFAVLDVLNGTDGLGPTELATRAGLPKATTHRILEQLVGEGAVERVDGRYRLGPTMFRLGGWRPAQRLRAASRLPLRELAAAVPWATVNLVLPFRDGTVIAGVRPGETDHLLPMRRGSLCGRKNEPGMLWAARGPDAEPPDGIPVAEWRRRVREVRERDGVFTAADSVAAPGIAVAGAPVHAPGGEVVGSVGCLVLDHRQLPRLLPLVCRAARLTSGNLARI
jgi:IclR family transcriptional regulator, acetate operon repressor